VIRNATVFFIIEKNWGLMLLLQRQVLLLCMSYFPYIGNVCI